LALTRRGKAFVTGGTVAGLLVVALGAMTLTGNAPAVVRDLANAAGITEPPPTCPLTGTELAEDKQVPARPVLAVKVENTPDAQPLNGLDKADIVYEEVVEGGITRFIAMFHCESTTRVGPVRSARTTDPKILLQFSEHPLLAFSGGANKVVGAAQDAGLTLMTEGDPAPPFSRDETREVPHNLFANTAMLWAAGLKRAKDEPVPSPVFTYSDDVPTPNKKGTAVTIVFSGLATAEWHWEGGRYVRYLDGQPMTLENGNPITTDNVVIQQVKTVESDIIDPAGYPSPEVAVTGKGKAWVLRNGRLIQGTWERAAEGDLTVFTTKSGETIALTPGTTFVELAPTGMFDADITFGS
jgi:hypothetical protein